METQTGNSDLRTGHAVVHGCCAGWWGGITIDTMARYVTCHLFDKVRQKGVNLEIEPKYTIEYRCLHCGELLGEIDLTRDTHVLHPSAIVLWVDGTGRVKVECPTEGCPGRIWEPKPVKKKLKT